ncbi:MAG TPA: hypothetical protein VMU89_02400 [Thermomicrobiaceae bacterium]|nr:hypothetical protein [Thermomicrobiaceae bacterium]
MSNPSASAIPSQAQVDRKLAGVQSQIDALRRAGGNANQAAVDQESCACAAVDQLLQASTAGLHGLNALMPDPLPHSRVSRRNLRDRFQSVQSDSEAIREVEAAARPREGWLWWLEQKDLGAAFERLLDIDDSGGVRGIWKDPLDHGAGFETAPPDVYLSEALGRVRALVHRIAALAHGDAARYNEAEAQQRRRLM